MSLTRIMAHGSGLHGPMGPKAGSAGLREDAQMRPCSDAAAAFDLTVLIARRADNVCGTFAWPAPRSKIRGTVSGYDLPRWPALLANVACAWVHASGHLACTTA